MGVLHVKAIEKIHSITFKSFLIVNFRPYLPPKKCFSSILHRLLLYYLTFFDLDPQRLKSLKLSLSRFVIIYRTSTFRRETENIQHTAFFCHCNVTIVCQKCTFSLILYPQNYLESYLPLFRSFCSFFFSCRLLLPLHHHISYREKMDSKCMYTYFISIKTIKIILPSVPHLPHSRRVYDVT